MNLVLFSLGSLFFTSLIGCSKPAKPFEEQHVLNLKKEFKNWQQSQIEKGVYLDSSRCNLEYFGIIIQLNYLLLAFQTIR